MSLHPTSAALRSVGCYLATCVNLLSGAKCCARKAFALLFVFSLCLSTSVFASNDEYDSGFIYPQSGLSINYTFNGQTFDILNGYFPASFTSGDFTSSPSSRSVFVQSSVLPAASSGFFDTTLTTASQFYIEVLYSVPAQVSFSIAESSTSYVQGRVGLGNFSSGVNPFGAHVWSPDISFVADGDLKPLVTSSSSSNGFRVPVGDYVVDHYFGYRLYFNPLSISKRIAVDPSFKLELYEANISYTFSEPNYLPSINDNITVNTGILQDINGKLTEIQTSTTQIKSDVSNIKDTVTDTNNQLQNPDSNIWQAAGSAISDAVTGLFVPEQAQLDAKMKEVENIVINKMGDTYEVIQKTQVYEDQFVAGFTGSGSEYAFNFPGISVPLPDGTVSILPEQAVHLQNKAFNVFRNLLGTVVAVLCGFSAVHLGHDFIICIFSGITYWGFLRSRHDR